MKKSVMNRMRLSIKDTLFKGVTRKVNQETSDSATETTNVNKSSTTNNNNNSNSTSSNSNNLAVNSTTNSTQRGMAKRNLTITIGVASRQHDEITEKIEGDFKTRNRDVLIGQYGEKEPAVQQQGPHIFEETYELMDTKLGQGCHGNVQTCKRKSDGTVFAVKMIRNGDTEIILSAITSFKIAQTLHHPSIIKPQELFINRETEKIFYVMEYCPFDSLQSYIENTLWVGANSSTKKSHLRMRSCSEASIAIPAPVQLDKKSILKIKRIIYELLCGVQYMHEEGICHRDLKPANILVNANCTRVKIIDLDISKRFMFMRANRAILKVSEMWTRTGTQDYMSPEMFESTGYTEAVDNWAVGVIAYQLLTGKLPFDQEYISDKIDFIREAKYNVEYLKNVDEVPKDFIRRMLKKDPKERLTAKAALKHPWFLVESSSSSSSNSTSGESNIIAHQNGPIIQITAPVSVINNDNISRSMRENGNNEDNNNEITKKLLRPDAGNSNKGNTTIGGMQGNNSNSNNSMMYFHSPQVSEKNPMLTHDDTAAQMFQYSKEMVLVKGNQSTILGGKDSSKFPFYFDRNRDHILYHRTSEDYQIRVREFDESEEGFAEGRGSIDLMGGENVNSIDCVGIMKARRKQSEDCEAKRKDAFQKMVKQFKEEMRDLSLIHINQKKVQPNKVSQLRLRLLMEKNEKEAQQALAANAANSAVAVSGINSIKETKETVFCSSAELAKKSNESGMVSMNSFNMNSAAMMSDFDDDAACMSGERGGPRSRSNTENELAELREALCANETRAKRLSEDFTSPCMGGGGGGQTPPNISMNLTAVNGTGSTFVVDANAFRKSTNLNSDSEAFIQLIQAGQQSNKQEKN